MGVIELRPDARALRADPVETLIVAGDRARTAEQPRYQLMAHALRLIIGVVPCALAGFYEVDDRLRRREAVAMATPECLMALPTVSREYNHRYHKSHPFSPSRFACTDHKVVTVADLGGEEGLRRTEYGAWTMTYGIRWEAVMFLRDSGRLIGAVTLFRLADTCDFTPIEVAFLRRSQPLIELGYVFALRAGAGPDPGSPFTGRGVTRRERQVAQLAAAGATNAEISRTLYISERTVKAHLTHVFAKLGLRSRTELAARLRAWSAETGGDHLPPVA